MFHVIVAEITSSDLFVNVMSMSSHGNVDEKIGNDLDALADKLSLCDTMINPKNGDPSTSVNEDASVRQVVGFLEACAPRMVDLVEAGKLGCLTGQKSYYWAG